MTGHELTLTHSWICIKHMSRHALLTLFRYLSVGRFHILPPLLTWPFHFSLYLYQGWIFESLFYLLTRFFFQFLTAHAFCLAPAHCAGDTYSVPHLCVDRTDYTSKFTFYYNIIITHVSFLPTTSDHLRWLPTSDDVIPQQPITLFREQWWPNRPPMLLVGTQA